MREFWQSHVAKVTFDQTRCAEFCQRPKNGIWKLRARKPTAAQESESLLDPFPLPALY
jgi:hypothetical protein